MSLNRRRGYIKASDQPDGTLERWEIPHYDGKELLPRETALNYDPGWEPQEESEDEKNAEPDIDLSMLTAEVLEQIRQSAVDEGMEEGRTLGHQEGHEAGFEEGKTAGFAEGKKEGYEKGIEDGQDEIKTHCQHLDALIDKLAFPFLQINHQVQEQVMELVVNLTKAIVETEVLTNPKVILNTVHETVKSLPMAERKTTVYLHPDDFEILHGAHTEEALKERDWKLMSEPSFHRGDIQVASGDSVVEFKLEERITQVLAQFLNQNHTPPPEPPENGMGADVLVPPRAFSENAQDPAKETDSKAPSMEETPTGSFSQSEEEEAETSSPRNESDTSEASNVSETPEALEVSEKSEALEASETSETSETPEALEASEAPEKSEVPEVSETPEALEASERSEIPESPQASDSPEEDAKKASINPTENDHDLTE